MGMTDMSDIKLHGVKLVGEFPLVSEMEETTNFFRFFAHNPYSEPICGFFMGAFPSHVGKFFPQISSLCSFGSASNRAMKIIKT
jgi:hypothetical protein